MAYKHIDLPRGTELFSIVSGSDQPAGPGHVVVCGEEIGGTHALMPTVRELLSRDIAVTALLAGNGQRIVTTRGHEHGLRAAPIRAWPEAALHPDAVLLTPSEDGRLEGHLLDQYSSTNFVVIEDYYESSRRAIDYASSHNLTVPTVCVVDAEAEKLIEKRFPAVKTPVVVTGTPTFDVLHGEDKAALQQQMKEELGVPEKKLIALLLPRLGHVALAEEVADALLGLRKDVTFAIRPHPSDPIDKDVYAEMFQGVDHIDTEEYHTDQVALAADLIIAQRSLTVLRAVARQQFTITLNSFVQPGFTLPLVDSGVSLPTKPVDLPAAIDELLEGTSDRCKALKTKMEAYKVDGKAASRVAEVVCRAMIGKR